MAQVCEVCGKSRTPGINQPRAQRHQAALERQSSSVNAKTAKATSACASAPAVSAAAKSSRRKLFKFIS